MKQPNTFSNLSLLIERSKILLYIMIYDNVDYKLLTLVGQMRVSNVVI